MVPRSTPARAAVHSQAMRPNAGSRSTSTDYAAKLAAEWASRGPPAICTALALSGQVRGRDVAICCPFHAEKNPSCNVSIGPQGTIRVHCFACGETWDCHALIGQVLGIDPRTAFRDLLRAEAELSGRWDILDALDGRARTGKPVPPCTRSIPVAEPRTYPDREEVLDLIGACTLTACDSEVVSSIAVRGLTASDLDCARAGLRASLAGRAPSVGQVWRQILDRDRPPDHRTHG